MDCVPALPDVQTHACNDPSAEYDLPFVPYDQIQRVRRPQTARSPDT